MRLRLLRHQSGEHPAEPHRLLGQVPADPLVAGGRRIPLIEDQVDDLQHGRQPRRQLLGIGDRERHLGLGEGAFGPRDPLTHGGARHQEGPGDLVGGQAADHAQGQGGARLLGQERVAGDKDQRQQVLVGAGLARRRGLRRELRVLLVSRPLPPDQVDRPAPGDGHQPGGRVIWYALLRPLLQRGDHGVLRQFLGQPEIPHQPGEGGDQARGVHPPDRLDRTPRVHAASLNATRLSVAVAVPGLDLGRDPLLPLPYLRRVRLAEILGLGVRADLQDLPRAQPCVGGALLGPLKRLFE